MIDVGAVRERIRIAAERACRDPAAVTIVAVTKTVDAARIREIVAAGVADIGENRVQEALEKQAQLPNLAARWHLIGHLQSNKAARAAMAFSSVQSIDSERIAVALADRRPVGGAPLPVLIEADLTGISARTGATADRIDLIVTAILSRPSLALRGFMTIAPQGPDEARRAAFRGLRVLRDQVEQRRGIALTELSMGMSEDFELAVEEGATIVRLGRVLFGSRPGGRREV